MTYLELFYKAGFLLNVNKITSEQYEKMIAPLHRQVFPDFISGECEPNECLAYLQWKNSLAERRADDET